MTPLTPLPNVQKTPLFFRPFHSEKPSRQEQNLPSIVSQSCSAVSKLETSGQLTSQQPHAGHLVSVDATPGTAHSCFFVRSRRKNRTRSLAKIQAGPG